MAQDPIMFPPIVCDPIRVPDGESEPEQASPKDCEGWRVYVHPHGRPYYYRTRSRAMLAVERLGEGREPPACQKWWCRNTVYLP